MEDGMNRFGEEARVLVGNHPIVGARNYLKEEIEMKAKGKRAKRKVMEGMGFEEKFEFAFRVSYFAMWIAFFAVAAALIAAGII